MNDGTVTYVDKSLFPEPKTDLYSMMEACPSDKVIRVSEKEYSLKQVTAAMAGLKRWKNKPFEHASKDGFIYLRPANGASPEPELESPIEASGNRRTFSKMYGLSGQYMDEIRQRARNGGVIIRKAAWKAKTSMYKAVQILRQDGFTVDGTRDGSLTIAVFLPKKNAKAPEPKTTVRVQTRSTRRPDRPYELSAKQLFAAGDYYVDALLETVREKKWVRVKKAFWKTTGARGYACGVLREKGVRVDFNNRAKKRYIDLTWIGKPQYARPDMHEKPTSWFKERAAKRKGAKAPEQKTAVDLPPFVKTTQPVLNGHTAETAAV